MHGKAIGCTLIVAGTAIGAGMLALPIVGSAAGFQLSFLLLIAIWAIAAYSALLILEVTLAFKENNNSFDTMAQSTLGWPGRVTAWAMCLLLLYALTSAYIAGASSLLSSLLWQYAHVHLNQRLGGFLFLLILGSFVYYSTGAVDLLNRFLMSFKGLFLIAALVLLFPKVDVTQLQSQTGSAKYLLLAAPIFFTSFGFHTVIPTLVNYLGVKPRKVQGVLIVGTLIPLILYTLWLVCTLGIVPREGAVSFQEVAVHHDSLASFLNAVFTLSHSPHVTLAINLFANVAMTTSFLGVTLGLFDFLADGFKRPNTRWGRSQTALLTFVPPLIVAMMYPRGFIMVLGYGAIFFAILALILPPLMVYRLRKSKQLKSPYRVWGGALGLWIIGLAGVAIIALEIAGDCHLLPGL